MDETAESVRKGLALIFDSVPTVSPKKERKQVSFDLSKHKILLDLPKKIALGFFIFSIGLLIVYQLSFVLGPNATPFLEPDNYMYGLFSSLALTHGLFNASITNPYLVYTHIGFFEAAGLYQVPALLHLAIPFIPLVWDFRILYALAVAAIYIVTLLITRRVMDNLPLNQAYRYTAYAIVMMSFLLMQQTEINEWRGNTFITAFGLIIFYLLCLAFLNKGWKFCKKLLCFLVCLVLVAASYYMWSGWIINLLPFAMIPIFIIYAWLKKYPKFYWVLALTVFFTACLISVFTVPIQHFVVFTLQTIHIPFGQTLNCFYNPLALSEVQCLNVSDGLYTVALDMFFLAMTIKIFLSNKTFNLNKNKYEYLIIGIAAMILLALPVVLLYVRLLQVIAPYLTLAFAIGTVTLLARMGASRFVVALVVLIILISSMVAVLTFWQTTATLVTAINPIGLQNAANWLSGYPNSTTFTFYAYGDYLEVYGHQKVYTDTIQELNIANVIKQDDFFSGDNCTLPNLGVKPDFIMASGDLSTFSLFQNVSHESFAYSPMSLEQCGYTLAYSANGFFVFRI